MPRLTRKTYRGVIRCARVFGYAPYAVEESGVCGPSRGWLVWCVLCRALLSALVLYSAGAINKSNATGLTASIAWLCLLILQLCVENWILWTRQFPRMWTVLNSTPIREGAPYVELTFPVLITFSALCYTPVGFAAFFAEMSLHRLLAISAPLTFVYLQHYFPLVLFSLLMHCIGERFRTLNRSFATLKWKKLAVNCLQNSLRSHVIAIRKEHRNIRATANELAFCYGPYLIAGALADIWLIVYELYKLLAVSSTYLLCIFGLLVVFNLCIRWIYLLFTAVSVSSQGNFSSEICDEFFDECILATEEQHELKLFIDSLLHKPVRVSLVGEVDLNIRLLFQVAFTVLGYVTILLQFNTSVSHDKDHQHGVETSIYVSNRSNLTSA